MKKLLACLLMVSMMAQTAYDNFDTMPFVELQELHRTCNSIRYRLFGDYSCDTLNDAFDKVHVCNQKGTEIKKRINDKIVRENSAEKRKAIVAASIAEYVQFCSVVLGDDHFERGYGKEVAKVLAGQHPYKIAQTTMLINKLLLENVRGNEAMMWRTLEIYDCTQKSKDDARSSS
jgi:hypothetical protein